MKWQLEYELKEVLWQLTLFPQAVQGRVMSSHFTLASVSVQVVNWGWMFALCCEGNRGSDCHHCSLPNNNESILFISWTLQYLITCPSWAKCPLPRDTSPDLLDLPKVGLGSSSPVHMDKCLLGTKRSWLIMSLLWKVLLQSSCSAMNQTEEKWWCWVSLILYCGWPNSDWDKKKPKRKQTKNLLNPNWKFN